MTEVLITGGIGAGVNKKNKPESPLSDAAGDLKSSGITPTSKYGEFNCRQQIACSNAIDELSIAGGCSKRRSRTTSGEKNLKFGHQR